MSIGYQVKKYLAQKEAAAAKTIEEAAHVVEVVAPEPEESSVAEDTTMASVLAQIAQMQQETAKLIASMKHTGAGDTGVIEKLLAQQEQLLVKTRPENPEHPGKSVYSYPEGDRKAAEAGKVKALKCPMRWVGYDLVTDTLTPQEVDLLNLAVPGQFRVTKADGKQIPFTVSAKYSDAYDNTTGRPRVESMEFNFQCKGENRENHMSMVAYLSESIHGSLPSADELMKEIERLKGELQLAKSSVSGVLA